MEEKARFNVKYMEEMKLYTHEEMLDRVIGTKGTPAREKYETDINNFLIGEAIKRAREAKNLTRVRQTFAPSGNPGSQIRLSGFGIL